jgi:hypothetical protein
MATRPGLISSALLLIGVTLTGCKDEYPELPTVPPSGTTSKPAKPLHPDALPPPEFPFEAPHGGLMTPVDGGRGYVEWTVEEGRLYYLDPDGLPLSGVEEAVLHIATPGGPVQVALVAFDDGEYRGVASEDGRLSEQAIRGVLRFRLNGEPCRVLIDLARSEMQPAAETAGSDKTNRQP